MSAVKYGGQEFVTSGEVVARLAPDVTKETLRNWTRPQGGRRPKLRPCLDPNTGQPVTVDGEYVFVWREVRQVERDVRGRGRPRAGAVRPVALR
ncbi:hypothetical protein [Salinispora arenicola]|uniref:hypothetical protein n=1 Tax=Salinispora arenicola TaxID=168697 RepID=UPI00036F5D42|nr:hypothetical protein [Salinispora arenicola]